MYTYECIHDHVACMPCNACQVGVYVCAYLPFPQTAPLRGAKVAETHPVLFCRLPPLSNPTAHSTGDYSSTKLRGQQ